MRGRQSCFWVFLWSLDSTTIRSLCWANETGRSLSPQSSEIWFKVPHKRLVTRGRTRQVVKVEYRQIWDKNLPIRSSSSLGSRDNPPIVSLPDLTFRTKAERSIKWMSLQSGKKKSLRHQLESPGQDLDQDHAQSRILVMEIIQPMSSKILT